MLRSWYAPFDQDILVWTKVADIVPLVAWRVSNTTSLALACFIDVTSGHNVVLAKTAPAAESERRLERGRSNGPPQVDNGKATPQKLLRLVCW
jgi:hypothetical protein